MTRGIIAVIAVLAISATVLTAQQPRARAQAADVHVLPLRGNVWVLVGAGSNITLSVGKEGVMLVDAGTAQMADAVVAAVNALAREVTASPMPVRPCAGFGCSGNSFASILGTIASPAPPKPIQYILNTNDDPDHVGGNATIAEAGTTYGGGPGLGAFAGVVKESATIYAHENVLERMSAAGVSSKALPTESYPGDDFKQFFNGEGVHLIHRAAHTDGDSIVYFRGSDVISAGDILSTTSYPVFDIARGGSINGIVDGLNYLLDLAIAEYQTEGGTLIVPGHGRVCDSADLATYRDMVTILRDRIQNMVRSGMTLAQVKASRPSKDYDPRYDVAGWTKDQFVEAVYKSLSGNK